MVNEKTKRNYVKPKFLILLLIVGYILFATIRSFSTSLFFSTNGRVTILYYSDAPKVISIGRAESVNYELFFDPEKRVIVPGGYGRYKVGALGKLAEIEKKPEILTQAFSSAISARVDYDMSASTGWRTHISLIDRVYLYFLLLNQKKSDFISLNTSYTDPAHRQDFSENSFQKKYKGFFYERRLRTEGKNISIVYKNYASVKTLSRIIEGEGIRVVDVSYKETPGNDCYIIDTAKNSETSKYLARTFNCRIQQGSVNGADIQLVLGEKLEKNWE